MIVRTTFRWSGVLAVLLALLPFSGWAQGKSKGAQGDTAGFDITRAVVSTRRHTFKVQQTQLLGDALRADELQPSTSLLVLDRPGGRVALITDQMASHHIAEGELQGEPWLVSFCVVCNTGVGMTPRVDGKLLHFAVGGAYNGLTLMRDEETGTLWDHITGVALYGPLEGERMQTYNLLHMSAERAVEAYPDLRVAISKRPIRRENFLQKLGQRLGFAGGVIQRSLTREDTRRPTMDLGLGVWSRATQRYYPLQTLAAAGNAIVDQLDGRTLVVYRNAREGVLDAFYAPTASARWRGDELRLDGGRVYRNGVLRDRAGSRLKIERPMQLFTRWYGFALTFPKTEIYESGRQ